MLQYFSLVGLQLWGCGLIFVLWLNEPRTQTKETEMVMIPWRESTRKRASKYKDAYNGFTRNDYALDFESIPQASIVEMVTRSYAHMLNNETISAVGRVIEKANKEGTPLADEFKWVHDRRMEHRQRVLDGKLGVRQTATPIDIDPVTREMQAEALVRLRRAVAKKLGEVPAAFPTEVNSTTSKVVVQGKRTLGEMVASLIASDDGTMRQKAEAKVEADRKAREAAVAESDDDADALFDESDEEEDEEETEC
jgi:hypothetical protein